MKTGYKIRTGQTGQTEFIPNLSLVDGYVLDNKFIRCAGGVTGGTPDYLAVDNVVSGEWRANRVGAAGANPLQCVYYPLPLLHAKVMGQSQFAEGRWISRSINSNVGLGVFVYGSAATIHRGYALMQWTTDPSQFYLARQKESDAGVNLGTLTGFASNDLIRLEGIRDTPQANKFTINIYRNGVLISSTVDSHVDAPAANQGFPVFYIEGFTAGAGSSIWKNIRFGRL